MPGAVGFFVPAATARLGVAMCGLSVLWAVHGTSGSFGQAGIATAAFAVADAAVGPQVARLVDGRGQRRVLPVTVSVFGAAVAALVVACAAGAPSWLLAALSGLAGASVPPVGALSAARWRRVAGDTDRMPAALSLEAAVNDTTFLLGPVLVTTLSATVLPSAGLVLSGCLVLGGMAVFLSRRATEPPPRPAGRGVLVDRRLLDRPFGSLFVVNLAMGLYFGGIPVAVTAFAVAHRAGALAGPIAAAASVVSLLAGLAYGATGHRVRPLRLMTAASLVLTVGAAALALVPGVPGMFAGYAVVGGCVAPVLIPCAILLQRATHSGVYTQAMTWINSASAIGIGLAAPTAGYLVQQHGWQAGFLGTAALTAALPATLALTHPILARLQPRRHSDAAARQDPLT
jgi:MFS family permease